jgi:hypothetical protein
MNGEQSRQNKIASLKAIGQRLVAINSGRGEEASAALTALAKRSKGTAQVIQRVLSTGEQSNQRKPPGGEPPRGRELVRVSNGGGQRIRTASVGSSTPATGFVTLRKNGKVVEKIQRIFAKPTQVGPKAMKIAKGDSVGLASGHVIGSAENKEYEHVESKRGRVVTAIGPMLLDTVVVNIDGATTGQRLGMYTMNPTSFGGRLQLLSNAFEQNRCRKLRLHYVPSVAATESGSIAMYMRNDIATPTLDVGTDELRHAATHNAFKQGQVWEEFTMEVSPDDALMRYVDQLTGDTRFSTQGILQVLAASDLVGPESGTYRSLGNLYLDYDYEFYDEELDYDSMDVPNGTVDLEATAYVPGVGEAVTFPCNVAPGAGARALVGLGAFLQNSDYLVYGVITQIPNGPGPTWFVADDDEGYEIVAGMGLWFRLQNINQSSNFANGTILAVPYRDLESASDPGAQNGLSDGCFHWADAGPHTFNLALRFRAVEMTE